MACFYFYVNNGEMCVSTKEYRGICAEYRPTNFSAVYSVFNDTNKAIVVSNKVEDIAAYIQNEKKFGIGKLFTLTVFAWRSTGVNSGTDIEDCEPYSLFTCKFKPNSKLTIIVDVLGVQSVSEYAFLIELCCNDEAGVSRNNRKSEQHNLFVVCKDNGTVELSSSVQSSAVYEHKVLPLYITEYAGMTNKSGYIYVVYNDFVNVSVDVMKKSTGVYVTSDYTEFVEELQYRMSKNPLFNMAEKSGIDFGATIHAMVFEPVANGISSNNCTYKSILHIDTDGNMQTNVNTAKQCDLVRTIKLLILGNDD